MTARRFVPQLGLVLRAYRESRGVTSSALARAMGVAGPHVSRLEGPDDQAERRALWTSPDRQRRAVTEEELCRVAAAYTALLGQDVGPLDVLREGLAALAGKEHPAVDPPLRG